DITNNFCVQLLQFRIRVHWIRVTSSTITSQSTPSQNHKMAANI
ncbi:4856_t:CDS:1, partial [Racocetra persica]